MPRKPSPMIPRPTRACSVSNSTCAIQRSVPLYYRCQPDPNSQPTRPRLPPTRARRSPSKPCLLYTSDAADDLLCVDLGGRRIIKKKKQTEKHKRKISEHA